MTDAALEALFSIQDESVSSPTFSIKDARKAAELLAGSDQILATAALLAAAAADLRRGRQAFKLLDAASERIDALRCEHGCEDWSAVEWTREAFEVEFLWAEERLLREASRALRDQNAERADTLLACARAA